MRIDPKLAILGFFAVSAAFAAPAYAFQMQNSDANAYGVPKFDIEEQAKNFSKNGTDTTFKSDGSGSVPFAGGSLHFGVQQGSTFNSFGPGFGPTIRNTGREFNHVVTPESLK
jgi:hypothetical protein